MSTAPSPRQTIQKMNGSVWLAAATGSLIDSGILDNADNSTAAEIAEATGFEERVVCALLEAGVALGLVVKEGDKYRPAEEMRAILDDEMERMVTSDLLRAAWMQADSMYFDARRRSSNLGFWTHDNPELLKVQGRPSQALVGMAVKELFPKVDGLMEAVQKPGAKFLDVGVGHGWIAIGAAKMFPEMEVAGVDPHGPAIEGARRNIQEMGLSDRITLHKTTVQELGHEGEYDLVFLPLFFFPDDATDDAIQAAFKAIRPGGYLMVPASLHSGDPIASAIFNLRDVMWGGVPRGHEEVDTALERAGFVDVQVGDLLEGVPFTMSFGRRPG